METTQSVKFWEALKDKCVAEFIYKIRTMLDKDVVGLLAIQSLLKMKEDTFENGYKVTQEVEKKCILAIRSTDIRCYMDLVRICPEAFPKWIQNGQCAPELLDAGWALVKK